MLKKWTVLLCGSMLPIILGCMEAAWVGKKMDEYEKKQEAQAKKAEEKGMTGTPTTGSKVVEIPVVAASVPTAEGEKPKLTTSEPEKPSGPQVVLKDGSIIKGNIKGEIAFQTELATLKVKGEDVLSYIGGTLKLKDGTILQGKIQEESLMIQTDYGDLEAKTESIANITGE